MRYLVYCDGAVEPKNPGGWGIGGWVIKSEDGQRLADGACDLGCYREMTNNIAEYGAVRDALQFMLKCDKFGRKWTEADLIIRSDSQLVIYQLTDQYQCRTQHLKKLRDEIWILLEKFTGKVDFEWIRREENEEADAMSRSYYKPEYIRNAPSTLSTEYDAKETNDAAQ